MVLRALLAQALPVGGDQIPNDINQYTFVTVRGVMLIYGS